MEHRFDKLEEKLDALENKVHEAVVIHRERIVKLETNQRGFFTGMAGIWALFIAYIGAKIGTGN